MSSKKKPAVVLTFTEFTENERYADPGVFYNEEHDICLCRYGINRVIEVPRGAKSLIVSVYKSPVKWNHVLPGGIRVWRSGSVEVGIKIPRLHPHDLFTQVIPVFTDLMYELGYSFRGDEPTMRNAWAAYSSLKEFSKEWAYNWDSKTQVKREYLNSEVPSFARKLWFAVEYE